MLFGKSQMDLWVRIFKYFMSSHLEFIYHLYREFHQLPHLMSKQRYRTIKSHKYHHPPAENNYLKHYWYESQSIKNDISQQTTAQFHTPLTPKNPKHHRPHNLIKSQEKQIKQEQNSQILQAKINSLQNIIEHLQLQNNQLKKEIVVLKMHSFQTIKKDKLRQLLQTQNILETENQHLRQQYQILKSQNQQLQKLINLKVERWVIHYLKENKDQEIIKEEGGWMREEIASEMPFLYSISELQAKRRNEENQADKICKPIKCEELPKKTFNKEHTQKNNVKNIRMNIHKGESASIAEWTNLLQKIKEQ